eukprot:930092-Prymnesium_polylepis.1
MGTRGARQAHVRRPAAPRSEAARPRPRRTRERGGQQEGTPGSPTVRARAPCCRKGCGRPSRHSAARLVAAARALERCGGSPRAPLTGPSFPSLCTRCRAGGCPCPYSPIRRTCRQRRRGARHARQRGCVVWPPQHLRPRTPARCNAAAPYPAVSLWRARARACGRAQSSSEG